MEYREVVENLDPDVVERLRRAIETGRWPDGRVVTAAQREHSLQAVIAWEAAHLPEDQRTGYIDRGARKTGARDRCAAGAEQPLRWRDDAGAGES